MTQLAPRRRPRPRGRHRTRRLRFGRLRFGRRPGQDEPAPDCDDEVRAGVRYAPAFDDEVRANVRYEKGLAVKAVIAVVLVLIVVGLRLLFLH